MGMERENRCGQWILMSWELESTRSVSPDAIVRQIRRGAELRRYWLRAYVVIGRKVSLLLYPTVALETVYRELRTALGDAVPVCVRSIPDDAALERNATYIEHLPIRNGVVQRPEDYNWSSAGWIAAPAFRA
jgi:hypothetical protein